MKSNVGFQGSFLQNKALSVVYFFYKMPDVCLALLQRIGYFRDDFCPPTYLDISFSAAGDSLRQIRN